MKSPPERRVRGHHLPRARLTVRGWLWLLVFGAIPVLLLGSGLDALWQAWTGQCVAWWCLWLTP